MESLSRNKKVLLVDDDHDDQEIFGVVVSELNEAVDCSYVDNAEDALQTLSTTTEGHPDYIFLDLNLPFMSGFDCLHALKKNSQLQNIPVIIYSTSSRETDKIKAKELGAKDYVSKPDTVSQLKNILQTILQ